MKIPTIPARYAILTLSAILLISSVSTAQTLYIKSIRASLLAEPRFGAKEIITLQRGDTAEQLEADGRWIKVATGSDTGWVSSLLIGPTPPLEKISVLNDNQENLDSGARRRASAFTSAAAARGLTERERVSSGYRLDSDAVNFMKSIQVSERDLEAFAEGKEAQ